MRHVQYVLDTAVFAALFCDVLRPQHLAQPVLPFRLRERASTCAPSSTMPCFALTEAELNAAFAAAEKVVFPEDELRSLLGAAWTHCETVANSLSVPVFWALLAEISAAAFLAPTAAAGRKDPGAALHAVGL